MIALASQIENIIVQTIQDKVPGVSVQSNPEALNADDYELKTSDGFILVAYLLSPRFERYRQGFNEVTLQFLIAFGYKLLASQNGLKSRMNDAYYALRGLQVAPMRSPLEPVALRPIGRNDAGIWRGDIIFETKVIDIDTTVTNA